MFSLRHGLLLIPVVALCVHAGDAPPVFLPLQELTNRFAVATVTQSNGITAWESPDMNVRFFENSRRLEFNGTLVWLNGAMTTNASAQPMITETDVDSVLVPLLAPVVPVAPSNRFVVILDPGHGGEDSGAVVTNAPPEKTLTLDIARRVRQILVAEGATVRMTRGSDRTLSLSDRTEFARRRHGSVLVSIHANKAVNGDAQGIETFILPAVGFPSTAATEPVFDEHPGNQQDAASMQLAFFIHRELAEQMQAVDRGVKRARFEVLRNAPCPAALLEIGFMSNAADRVNIGDPEYRERLAECIAFGIRLYMLQNGAGGES
jgi:N-acetylmuramoyl-L-alanine amidase